MPLQSPRGGLVGGHESAHSGVAAGRADDYLIINDKRSAGRPIVLHFVGILDVPYQVSRAGVEAEQVRVIRFGIDEVLPHRYATILVSGGVVQQSRTDGTTVVPQTASRARIQGEDIVGGGY